MAIERERERERERESLQKLLEQKFGLSTCMLACIIALKKPLVPGWA